jgi:dihydroorotate dehydrogenase (NAD+) catalytic subunit
MLRGFGVLSGALAELTQFLEAKHLRARDLIGVAADRRRGFAAMPLRQDNWRRYVPQ